MCWFFYFKINLVTKYKVLYICQMKKKSLLEKAKEIKTQKRIVDLPDEMDSLALAWCRGEITHSQIAKVLGYDNTGYRVYAKIAISLKSYLNKNHKYSIQSTKK